MASSDLSFAYVVQEKRKQRAEAEAKRLGMEHLAKKGQKLGHGPAQQATSAVALL